LGGCGTIRLSAREPTGATPASPFARPDGVSWPPEGSIGRTGDGCQGQPGGTRFGGERTATPGPAPSQPVERAGAGATGLHGEGMCGGAMRRGGPKGEVPEELSDHLRLCEEDDEPHWARTAGTHEGVHLVHLLDQPCPGALRGRGGDLAELTSARGGSMAADEGFTIAVPSFDTIVKQGEMQTAAASLHGTSLSRRT